MVIYYLFCKRGRNFAIISAYRVCKQTNPGDLPLSKQQLGIMYKDGELRPYLVDPHKQTLNDLQYFVEKLKATGHEALILMDTNQAEEQAYQQQTHNIKLVMKKGFHVNGTIDGYLQTFMLNCSLTNILRQIHEGVVPNTDARGSVQICFPLLTSGLVEHVLDVRPVEPICFTE
jgi:hypothetical protein